MAFIYFTEEQKQRANNADLAEFLLRQGEKLIPSGRDKRLASNRSITALGGVTTPPSAVVTPSTLCRSILI